MLWHGNDHMQEMCDLTSFVWVGLFRACVLEQRNMKKKFTVLERQVL